MLEPRIRYDFHMAAIAFAGGGTGGHIYPGLAIIAKISGHRIIWIGSKNNADRSIVEDAGIEFFGIPAGKLRRYFSLKTIPDAFKVAAGFFSAKRILKKQKVSLLFSKGGFVSVPPCAAAASLGIPVFTHESDFSPGLATKLNLKFVLKTGGRVFLSYPDTAEFLPEKIKDRVSVSGNPIRPAFRNADPAKGRAFLKLGPKERILLVLGGSQGAKEINELIGAALDALCSKFTVVHQYGPEQEWNMPKTANYIPVPFIREEMPDLLAAAELIVGRSGAGTVWECAALGKPMILIPLCGSGTRGDQVENARYFEKAGAAAVLAANDANAQMLCETVNVLAEDSEKRQRMSAAALCASSVDGAEIISNAINEKIKQITEIHNGHCGN